MSEAGKKMADTVTQAEQDREKQGSWEAEITYGGEADLHRHYSRCLKNPGHQNFIPLEALQVDNLPVGYQDNDLLSLILAMSHLTVRVSVNYVSRRRPESVPGKKNPYPSYLDRGNYTMRVGSGYVRRVDIHQDMTASIVIHTAAHVVYDELEAAHTTCHLFFDQNGTPDTCSGVVTLDVMTLSWSYLENDWCMMTYNTRDMNLAHALQTKIKQRNLLQKTVVNKYRLQSKKKEPQDPELASFELQLAVIVSHPHGCSKQVSLGHCVHRDYLEVGNSMYAYTAATCPGSSGALVFVMDRDGTVWYHLHRGNCEENKGLNYGSIAFDALS